MGGWNIARFRLAGSVMRLLALQVPTVIFHFATGPALQLFKQGGLDDHETDTHSSLISHPHQASFGLKANVAVWKQKIHVEQASVSERFFHTIQTHAARAQVHALHLNLFAL